MAMKQSYALGSKVRNIDVYEKMDPDNDIYTPLLITGNNAKTEGIGRLIMPMNYLCVARYREVLNEYISDADKKQEIVAYRSYHQENIIHDVTTPNHRSNMSYRNNHEMYDEIFWSTLRSLKDDLLSFNVPDIFGRTPIEQCVRYQHYHQFFALLNYGFTLSQESIDKISDTAPESTLVMISFIKSEKLRSVMDSQLPNGCKLLSLVEDCPITMEKIIHPIICADGQIYEYIAFKRHILINGYVSPINNEPISPHIYHITEDRFEKLLTMQQFLR